MAEHLYVRPFTWFIHNDDNRVADGKALRIAFLEETGYPFVGPVELWLDLDCSMLEMLLALAQRAAFESDGQPAEWFWRLMHNLELDKYTDAVYNPSIAEEVDDTLTRLNLRGYDASGTGGLFPLRVAQHDQRTVELWYQLQAYLLEGLYTLSTPRH